MRKLAAAAWPAIAFAVGVAMSRYSPGARRLPLRRPLKRNVLVPATPARVKLPLSVMYRVHLCRLRLRLVARSHVTFLAWEIFLPLLRSWTVKRTLAPTL